MEAEEVNTTGKVLVSGEEKTKAAAAAAGELAAGSLRGDAERKASTHPPVDDCCPICFDEFSVACKANCGHWYCGLCILQLWIFSADSRPCKCPMCSSNITKLRPEASFFEQQDLIARQLLQFVAKYNRLYVGGTVYPKASTHPHVDDCCPICFGEFSVPCKANCGHWYCGRCILLLWNFSEVSRPCKCTICSSSITNLTLEASFFNEQDLEAREVWQSVARYNRLYVGGARGLVQKAVESPFLFKRLVNRLMDPDRPGYELYTDVQSVGVYVAVGLLYSVCPLEFIGPHALATLFLIGVNMIVVTLQLIGIYRRRRLRQRQMAAEPLYPRFRLARNRAMGSLVSSPVHSASDQRRSMVRKDEHHRDEYVVAST